MRVLTWNLFHGRAVPPAGHALLNEFSGALAGWAWDVALLQEAPPWWPAPLAAASGADWRRALTSRNLGLPLRRWIAERWPDLIKSNGGGCNAILVRPPARIVAHRVHRLRWWPERRVVHGIRLGCGAWMANVHACVRERAPADVAGGRSVALGWARGAPLVLGGDFNTVDPPLPGFVRAAAHGIDGVWARGLAPAGAGEVMDSGRLSDHRPVVGELSAPRPAGGRTPAA